MAKPCHFCGFFPIRSEIGLDHMIGLNTVICAPQREGRGSKAERRAHNLTGGYGGYQNGGGGGYQNGGGGGYGDCGP